MLLCHKIRSHKEEAVLSFWPFFLFLLFLLLLTICWFSYKFSSKIKYVHSLAELWGMVPMEYVHIPTSIVKWVKLSYIWSYARQVSMSNVFVNQGLDGKHIFQKGMTCSCFSTPLQGTKRRWVYTHLHAWGKSFNVCSWSFALVRACGRCFICDSKVDSQLIPAF